MEDYEKRAKEAEKQIEALLKRIDLLENQTGPIARVPLSTDAERYKKERDEAILQAAVLRDQLKRVAADSKNLVPAINFSSEHALTHRLPIKHILHADSEAMKELIGKTVIVAGWARTIREQGGGRFAFVELNDGSSFANLQIIVDEKCPGFADIIGPKAGTGASIMAEGRIVQSPGTKQAVEMQAETVELLGQCIPAEYPLSKTKLKLEMLRSIAHLRPRTNTIGAMIRVRSACAFATHQFFKDHGFVYVHTPILTTSDCEGAGEMFQVTTLLRNGVATMKEVPTVVDSPNAVDYSKDFFGKPSFLTVSGQLNGEMYASAIGKIYTFGPTFRAENSHTTRHAAEFWMIEPEMAFCDLKDNMDYAEAYIKYVVQYVLANNMEDLEFFDKLVEKGLIQRLKQVLETPFKRLTYTEGVDILIKSKHKFENKVAWGVDLSSEHEKYLTDVVFKMPVILSDYPKDIKAFYMRMNPDGKTVSAMDVLVPKIGELVGGSQREERLDKLEQRMVDMNLSQESYKHYLDLRRFGSVVHSGFGLGFERMIMFMTGIENIRDAIPFPRWPGHAEF